MNPRRLAVLALFCSLLAASSTSANPILRGRIVDANGAPVAGAVLEIKGTKLRTTSDEDGAYQVELPPGSYTLGVKRIGYSAEERRIRVPGPETEGEGLNLTLAPAPVPMRPVEIAGTWSLLHARGFALPVADLSGDRLRNGATVSLARAIEGLAGVHDLHTGEQIGKPVIRGMTGPRVLVLDDGLRLEDYSWSEEDGPSIDARLAQRVEVVRGPASVLFGSDALGGSGERDSSKHLRGRSGAGRVAFRTGSLSLLEQYGVRGRLPGRAPRPRIRVAGVRSRAEGG